MNIFYQLNTMQGVLKARCEWWIALNITYTVPVMSYRTRSWSTLLWTPTLELRWSCSLSSVSTTHLDWWAGCHSQPPADRRKGQHIDMMQLSHTHTVDVHARAHKMSRHCRSMIDCSPCYMVWSQSTVSISSSFLFPLISQPVISNKPCQQTAAGCSFLCVFGITAAPGPEKNT